MRAVSAVLIAGAVAQTQMGASLGASLGANFGTSFATNTGAGVNTGLGAAKPAVVTGAAPPAGTPTTRGIPIGTATGIKDSDVACAQGVTAACGMANIASIYNPNPNMRYQTQASDNALSLLQSTNRYTTSGARIVTGNPALDFNTLDIPTQNAFSSGVATTGLNGFPVQQTTQWLNNGFLPNAMAPSASNAVLPNSAAFAQANLAPWTTTPVNQLTGAGFGYSVAQGVRPANLGQAPVTQFGQPLTGLGGNLGTWGTASFSNAYSRPGVYGPPSQLGVNQFPQQQFPLQQQFPFQQQFQPQFPFQQPPRFF
jgi:hypothetical protein